MTISENRPTTAFIDLGNLACNLRSIRQFIGPQTKCLAVVKANAYGHGAVECSRRLSREGIDWFGVALPEEGIELRRAGIEEPILVLGGFWPGQEHLILEYRLVPVVWDAEQAALLDKASAIRRTVSEFHVKIDTGMGRIGVRHDNVSRLAERLRSLRHVKLSGLMTHFAAADDPEQNQFTQLQIARFDAAVAEFERHGHDPVCHDLANSPGAFAFPSSRRSMVRLGGVLYGLCRDVLPPNVDRPILKPVLSLRSRISHLKSVPAGETLGYGRTFETGRDSLIASVPIGYADGVPRSLSNKGHFLVGGEFAPIVGRISMDWTLIDVTDISGVETGSEVIVIGSSGANVIEAEDVARSTGTISYEITCRISGRVTREYTCENLR